MVRIPVTIEVTDEDEPPGKPEAPTVEGHSSSSVLVRWEEPENRGPAIHDYDVEYRREGADEYTDAAHEGVEREFEITHLRQRANYEFRVRARNEEGGRRVVRSNPWPGPHRRRGHGSADTPTGAATGSTAPTSPHTGAATAGFCRSGVFAQSVRGDFTGRTGG